MKMHPEALRILREWDIKAAAKLFPFVPSRPDVVEAGMHKARIMAGQTFSFEERKASRSWLLEHGYKVPGE